MRRRLALLLVLLLATPGSVGTYWNMYDNGVSTGYGVDGFVADPGDELGFAYQVFCFAAVCPPV